MKRRRRKKPGSIPFYREFCAVQIQYDRMSSALDGKDPGKVRATACRLVRAWLRVEAAFIRFIEGTPAAMGLAPGARRERLALTGSNYLVKGLLRRALDETPGWAMSSDELRALRVVLRWLHERLESCSAVELPVLHS